MENIVVGVGLLLFCKENGDPKIFIVKELRDKPAIHKRKEMHSFPLETALREEPPQNTINRLLDEEMGIVPKDVQMVDIIPERFSLITGRPDIYTMYGVGIFSGDSRESFTPKDGDVEFVGWKTPCELIRYPSVRVEVAPILWHFLGSKNYQEVQRRLSGQAA